MPPTPLTQAEISAFVAENPGWSFKDDALCAEYRFADFRSAFAFLTRIAFECETADHHAEIFNVYNRVRLRLSTHDAGNKVSPLDIRLATAIQPIATAFGAK